jgi:hypothetical protein
LRVANARLLFRVTAPARRESVHRVQGTVKATKSQIIRRLQMTCSLPYNRLRAVSLNANARNYVCIAPGFRNLRRPRRRQGTPPPGYFFN